MRKAISALLLTLMMLSGCADVSTAPEKSDKHELVTETEAPAETESAESSSFSESKESEAEETGIEPERDAEIAKQEPAVTEAPEQTKPVTPSEAETPEIEPTVTESSSAPVKNPEETPPAEIPPQTATEDTKPESAYDYEFDIEAIKADCIGIGQGMGLSLDSSLTPSNAAWWNPRDGVTEQSGRSLEAEP